MDFWEIVGLLFTGFVLVTYLVVVFEVVRGVLRDRDLPGWAKALWLIALVFVPLLTAIVYVLVRGNDSNFLAYEHDGADSAAAHQAQYERSVSSPSPTQEIAHAKSMWDSGVIDRAEFDALKLKALT